MNIRKSIDYTPLFGGSDVLILEHVFQMRPYQGREKLVSERRKKGAAVAATEYLQSSHPGMQGLSPRNVRRMEGEKTAHRKRPSMTLQWAVSFSRVQECK